MVLVVAACGGDASPTTEVRGRDLQDVYHAAYARTVPPTSRAAWEARADALRDRMWTATRLDRDEPAPAAVGTEPSRSFGDVRLEDLLIDGFDGMRVPALLYLPAAATSDERVPGVVANVGHDARGKDAPYVREVCWTLARHGIACLVIDWWGMGSRFGSFHRHVPLGLRSFLAGLLPVTPILAEPLAAWRYLAARPEIDPTRVGIAGHSGGGMVSLHLGAMEPRIAAVAIVDIVTSNRYQFDELDGWGDPDSFVPGLAAVSSHGELLAMMAPRPVLVMHTDDDVTAPTAFAAPEWEIAEAAQRLYGGDRFEGRGFDEIEPAHCWCEPKILATAQFFADAFGLPAITATAMPPADSEGRARPPEGERRWLDLLLARLATTPAAADLAVWRAPLLASLREMLAVVVLPSADLDLVAPADAETAVLWLSDAEAPPPPVDAWVLTVTASWLELGQLGEDLRRYAAQNAIWLGRSILGYAADDVSQIARGARAAGVTRVIAVCDGPQASLVCLAAATTPGDLDGVVVRGLVPDFERLIRFGDDPYVDIPFGMSITPDLARLTTPDAWLAAVEARAVVGAGAGDFPVARAVLPTAFGDLDLATATARVIAGD
jgi:dienelactone hydrolase